MLQSIQHGIGPPKYIYSEDVSGSSGAEHAFFRVLAGQMKGYDARDERPNQRYGQFTHAKKVEDNTEKESYLMNYYEKECRRRLI